MPTQGTHSRSLRRVAMGVRGTTALNDLVWAVSGACSGRLAGSGSLECVAMLLSEGDVFCKRIHDGIVGSACVVHECEVDVDAVLKGVGRGGWECKRKRSRQAQLGEVRCMQERVSGRSGCVAEGKERM